MPQFLEITRKNHFILSFISTFILVILWVSNAQALIATSTKGIDTLPDKIFDDLVIRDKQAVSLKINEIAGDLIISAEKINVTANQVGGNLNAIGAEIFMGGRIRQSARMLGYRISTDAAIGRNLTVMGLPTQRIMGFGSTVEILRDSRVSKDVDIDAASVIIKGTIGGDLRIKAEYVTIGGDITGNVTITARRQLKLEPSCRIEGILTYSSPHEARIEEGAQVLSGIIDFERTSYRGLLDIPLSWRIVFGFAALIVGIVFILIFRRQILNLAEIMRERFGQSLGIGILGGAALIIYTAVFASTFMFALFYMPVFIFVPVLIIIFILILLIFYLANIIVAISLGRTIVRRITGNVNCSPGRSLILGLIILIPLYGIPYAGIYLFIISAMLGFGTFMIAIYRQLKSG